MAKIKKHYNKSFTVIRNSVIQDVSLSWKARGIFAYLWSQPADWDFYVNEVARHSSDGRDALRSGLEELEKHGYLKRHRVRNEKGYLGDSVWNLYEEPTFSSPMSENTTLDNATLQNTNQTKYQPDKVLTRDTLSSSTEHDHMPYQQIVDYLNKNADTKYRYQSKKTQSLIKARVHEGFKLEDFKKVIDHKVQDWAKDEKMVKFLRPETLFGTKFESYLNEKPAKSGVYQNRGEDDDQEYFF